MDKTTRDKALMFAAKTVASVAFLAACSSSEAAGESAGEEAAENAVATKSPACAKAMPALKAVFPEGDGEWWRSQGPHPELKGDKAVAECCATLLPSDEPFATGAPDHTGKFRALGCCSADFSTLVAVPDAGAADATDAASPVLVSNATFSVGAACTPWGPPVPPAMDWMPEGREAARGLVAA